MVSSTVSGTPALRLITSAASDEPPIPDSTTWSRPSSRACAQSTETGPSRARELRGAVSQPSLAAASSAAAGPHSPGSFATSAAGTPSEMSAAADCCSASITAIPRVLTVTPPPEVTRPV